MAQELPCVVQECIYKTPKLEFIMPRPCSSSTSPLSTQQQHNLKNMAIMEVGEASLTNW